MEARVASMMGWQVAVWRRFAGGLLGFAGYGVSQAVFGAVGNCRRLGFVCACAGCVGYVGCRQAVLSSLAGLGWQAFNAFACSAAKPI